MAGTDRHNGGCQRAGVYPTTNATDGTVRILEEVHYADKYSESKSDRNAYGNAAGVGYANGSTNHLHSLADLSLYTNENAVANALADQNHGNVANADSLADCDANDVAESDTVADQDRRIVADIDFYVDCHVNRVADAYAIVDCYSHAHPDRFTVGDSNGVAQRHPVGNRDAIRYADSDSVAKSYNHALGHGDVVG